MNNPPAPPTRSQAVPTPGMPGYFAYEIRKSWWPQVNPDTVEGWAETHRRYGLQLTWAAEESQHNYARQFQDLLQGRAGQTLQTALDNNALSWLDYADYHKNAAIALSDAASNLRTLEHYLNHLIDEYGDEYDSAYHNPHSNRVNEIAREAWAAAKDATSQAADGIKRAFQKTPFGTMPTALQPQLGPGIVPENPGVLPPDRQPPGGVLTC